MHSLRPPAAARSQALPLDGAVHISTDTAEPSLTSGFGAVLDHERDLQAATEAYLRVEDSEHGTSLHHVLREQSSQLGGNIALLAQRYDALPQPQRFRAFHGRIAQTTLGVSEPGMDPLRPLIIQHRNLLASIAKLMMLGADGQRGELILGEVARSHEEMAETLRRLVEPGDTVYDAPPLPAIAAFRNTTASERRWEHEGGALRPPPFDMTNGTRGER